MTRLITSTLSSKAQLTLPKEVRAILGLGGRGSLVGFLVDSEAGTVNLAKVETRVSGRAFSHEECGRILGLKRARGGKGFNDMAGLIKDLKR